MVTKPKMVHVELSSLIESGAVAPMFVGNEINPELPQSLQDAVEESVDRHVKAIADDIDREILNDVMNEVPWRCNYPTIRTRRWR